MRALFVTETDTGVGKTLVSVSLAAFFSLKMGLNVGVMKPFETGLPIDRTELFPCDAKSLKDASGSTDNLGVINPCTFELPLAPETAAQLDGEDHRPDRYRPGIRENPREPRHYPCRRGWWYTRTHTGRFLLCGPYCEVGIAHRGRLRGSASGTINHTLLTCRTLEARGIRVMGVVLNDTEGSDDTAARTNPEMLRKYLNVPVLGVVPHLGVSERENLTRDKLAGIAAGHIDTKSIYDGAVLQSP